MTERRIIILLLAGICSWIPIPSALALTFAARPTLTNCNNIVDLGTWSGKAMLERQIVVGITNPVLPMAGSQSQCIEAVKTRASGLLGTTYWVDMSLASGGSFAGWFAATNDAFPNLSTDVLLSASGLPTNWLSVTPSGGLAASIYGWPGITGIYSHIVATKQSLVQRDSTYEWAAYLNVGASTLSGACGGTTYDGPISIQDSAVLDASDPGPGVWHHAVRLGIGLDTNQYINWAGGGYADRMKSKYRVVAEIPTNYTPRGDTYHRAEVYLGGGGESWPTGYTAVCSEVTTNTSPYLHAFEADVSAVTTIAGKRYVVSSYDTDFDSFSSCGLCTYGSTNFGYPSDDCGDGPWYLPGEDYVSGGCADLQWRFGNPQEGDNGYPLEINGFFMTATMLLRWNVSGGFQFIDNAPTP